MKIILLFCLLVSGCYTTSAQNICGGPGSLPPEFDIADINKYIHVTKKFIRDYYDNLILVVGEESPKEVFAKINMAFGTDNYVLEFLPVIKDTLQRYSAKEYMDELDKAFLDKDRKKLDFKVNEIYIQNYTITPDECTLIVYYRLTLKDDQDIVFTRNCRARCRIDSAYSLNAYLARTDIIRESGDFPPELTAKNFIYTFYNTLLPAVSDSLSKETFISRYMLDREENYVSEFLPDKYGVMQWGSPIQYTATQYIEKYLKIFTPKYREKLKLEVSNVCIHDSEIKLNECIVITEYQLTLKYHDKVIFMRKCQAHCQIKNEGSLSVKLMRTNVIRFLPPLTQ